MTTDFGKLTGAGASRSWQPAIALRSLRHAPSLVGGLVIVSFIVIAAMGAPLFAPADPTAVNVIERFAEPSAAHPFGTDELGRDVLSRILFGARISLTSGLLVVLLASAVGTVLGLFAGIGSRWVDEGIMRIADMFLAFPYLILAMAIVAALGPGLQNAMVAVAITWWPGYARLVRGQILSLKGLAYVDAARVAGAGTPRLLFRHLLPNTMSPLLVKMTSDVGFAILSTASLGFVGLGARPPSPEWGAMLASGRAYLIDHWWLATFPGLAIFLTVFGFGLLGDGLRDILDPRLRRS